jgi:DNA repair protein RecO (recombination protein O)
MSEIIKTEAIVLSKLNYGDSSSIVSLFTKEYGKFSAIIKGGRNPKSKVGVVADPLNYIQLVVYKKDNREIQIVSSADLISYYPKIKEDLEKLKYSQAVLELLKKLTVEHEVNVRLFKGVIRIFSLFDSSNEQPIILFGRFFIFFITELGYEIQLDKCSVCGRTNLNGEDLSYNYEMGIFCSDCRKDKLESYFLNSELFHYLICLKNSKKIEKPDVTIAEKAVVFMERFLTYHIPDFKGIQAIQLFK